MRQLNTSFPFLLFTAAVTLCFGTLQAQTPIGYWTFDSDTAAVGGITDLAGGDHNATLGSGAFSTDAPTQLGGGMSLNLTGGSDYAIVNSFSGGATDGDFNTGNAHAVSTWIKGWPNGSWEPFVAKRGEGGQGWQIRRHGGSNGVSYTLRGTSAGDDGPVGIANTNALASADWVHVAGTYNGNQRYFYVNGILDGVETVDTGNIAATNAFVTFGARDNSTDTGPHTPSIGNNSQIQIDDTAVYGVGLSQNQIRHLAAGGAADALPTAEGIIKPVLNPLTGKYYEFNVVNQTWDQSRVDAGNYQVLGAQGHLATISDAAENTFVNAFGGGDRWIGGTDSDQTSTIDSTNLGATEGAFQWVTGESFSYTNWNAGEPNNSGGAEDAMNINASGLWNDHQAGSTLGQGNHTLTSIVEFDTTLGPTLRVDQYNGAPASLFNDNDALLAHIEGNTPDASGDYYAINFTDPNDAPGGGSFNQGDVAFPGDAAGDDNTFAIDAYGKVYIPSDGDYTFGTDSDDNVELFIDGSSVIDGACCGQNFGSVSLTEGLHDLRLIFFENAGGADLELFAAAGIHTSFGTGQFELVGDIANGGLALAVPEPATTAIWSLLGLVGVAFAIRQRRRKVA